MTTILQSTLTCPECGTQAVETMPTDACLYFYSCTGCGTRLKPKRGDCCVFCSYGSVPCPPIQEGAGSACCGATAASAVPECCSLEPGPFRERVDEITALLRSFDGSVRPTPTGIELRFRAQDGLRAALEALAEKERACCATLDVSVREQAGAISFCIDGKEGDRPRIDELVSRLGLEGARQPQAHAACCDAPPAAQLRPNVPRPDWSKVALPKAREVLQRRLVAYPAGVGRWHGLDAAEDQALTMILRHFARHGRAPSPEDMAAASGQPVEHARQCLERLHARDLVVLDHSRSSILAAYPFTTYATGHRVTLRGQAVDSLCAIDALGAGAMCGTAASIESACAHCGAPIQIETAPGGTDIAAVNPAGAVVWYTLTFAGRAAQSCCPSTVFFCGDDHLTAWLADDEAAAGGGERLSITEAFQIGVALFEPMLKRGA